MAKFNLNLRDAGATDETPVHLIVRFNNQKVVVKTGYSVNPKAWDKNKQRLSISPGTTNVQYNKQINAKLTERLSQAEGVFIEFETINKRQPTAKDLFESLKTAFDFNTSPAVVKTGLFEFMEQLLNKMATGLNPDNQRPYSPGTIKTYNQCIEKLREYATTKKKKLDFDSIDEDFYISYYEFLTSKGFKPNYIGKLIKMLKTFLNEALERGLTENITHKKRWFIAPKEKVSNIYLTLEELTELWNLDFSKEPRLEKVRDLFLFGCFTGLRFSDFSTVKKENINLREEVIEIETKKTGELVSIPILPITRAILNKYEGLTANSLPESISNQKFNKYLKEICQRFIPLQSTTTKDSILRGMKVSQTVPKWQLVTTHTARRSFATNMFLKGFPAQAIMKITGHRTEAAFMTYLKMSPRDNANFILKKWAKEVAAS